MLHRPKNEQKRIVEAIVKLLDSSDEDARWLGASLIEEILEYDSCLVQRDTILRMSEDESSHVRSAASVCWFTLANIAPSQVPLDIVIKLSSIKEDWYVFTPALATLKTLAHEMPRALDTILEMVTSDNVDEGEYGLSALLDVVRNEPRIVDMERVARLEKNLPKHARKILAEIRSVITKGEGGPNMIRYSPF